jgi:hypothetical protein
MGEPLSNYEAVRTAVSMMTDPRLFGLSRRHVTVSTVGVVPRIRDMARDMPVGDERRAPGERGAWRRDRQARCAAACRASGRGGFARCPASSARCTWVAGPSEFAPSPFFAAPAAAGSPFAVPRVSVSRCRCTRQTRSCGAPSFPARALTPWAGQWVARGTNRGPCTR